MRSVVADLPDNDEITEDALLAFMGLMKQEMGYEDPDTRATSDAYQDFEKDLFGDADDVKSPEQTNVKSEQIDAMAPPVEHVPDIGCPEPAASEIRRLAPAASEIRHTAPAADDATSGSGRNSCLRGYKTNPELRRQHDREYKAFHRAVKGSSAEEVAREWHSCRSVRLEKRNDDESLEGGRVRPDPDGGSRQVESRTARNICQSLVMEDTSRNVSALQPE